MKTLYFVFTLLILFLISCSGNNNKLKQNLSDPIDIKTQTKIKSIEDSLGSWKIHHYIDEFEEQTNKLYIALRTDKGIFATPGTIDSDLDVVIAADEEHTEIRLFKHRRDYQTKLTDYVDFKIKEPNGNIHNIKTFEGSTFKQNKNTNDSLFRAILSKGGELKFTAMVKEYGNETRYSFTIPNSDHFLNALNLIISRKVAKIENKDSI